MAGVAMSLDQFAADIGKAAAGLRRPVGPLLKQASVLIRSDLARGITEGRSPSGAPFRPLAWARPRGGSKPLLDTGVLRASLTAGPGHVERVEGNSLVIGTRVVYAALHQYGGTVVPKKGRYLAIPKTREAARAGSPRRMKVRMFAKFGNKGGVLVERRGKGKRAREVVHFALVRQVRVPARPFIGLGQETRKKLDRLVADDFAKTLGGR